ncbi:hypothetical protein PoB_000894700 [Plakobranchus ocellatus]|uniref:Uncharacterized protein n=1 Tax=Plakobranchus ocellatus TaxID=259542 RepID=A0AAV3YHX4_9GAST|nr:hypothetical protein PoB_000894700 [Plakobranchus ocellatus]
MATKHNTSRRWSSNLTYTGLTKIHSDVLSGTTARNTLANRRTSCVLSTESNLHQKELRSLDLNKQALKNSMLAYSEKMRNIASEKSRLLSRHPTEQHYAERVMTRIRTDIPKKPKAFNFVTDAFVRQSSAETIVQRKKVTDEQSSDFSVLRDISSERTDPPFDPQVRMSIDSGISIDSKNDCAEILSDSNSFDHTDSCGSDSDSIASWSCLSTRSDSCFTLKSAIKSEECPASDGEASGTETTLCKRKSRRRKWRVGKENPQLPTVLDDESFDDERVSSPTNNGNADLSIMPFPLNNLGESLNSSELFQSKVSGPLSRTDYRYFRVRSASEDRKPQDIKSKPKPVQSPSVTTIRLRRSKHKPKQDAKQECQRFRYSEQMGTSIEKQVPPHSTQLGVSALRQMLSMDSIQEMPADLEIEDSLSETIFDEAIAQLEIVSARSDKELKSALRKENFSEPHGKKHVHFFLPDIFKR